MITIACCLWDSNERSFDFSRCYDVEWVEKLFHGFRHNLSKPFRFVCWSERDRRYSTPLIEQRRFASQSPSYADALEPFSTNEPTLLVGLDTIVTGNCDALADYCMTADKPAVPRDPFESEKLCNGVVLAPAGCDWLWWRKAALNDMEMVRAHADRFAVIDDLFPGQCVSYKGQVMEHGVGDARIVYFHGVPKADSLSHIPWIREKWSWL